MRKRMTQREIFTQVYLSLVPQMFAKMKEVYEESDDLEECMEIAVRYSGYAQAIAFGWSQGIDGLNDRDLQFHASGSGREATSSASDLFSAYPRQSTESERPPESEL